MSISIRHITGQGHLQHFILTSILLLVAASCSTGIESTKKIKMNKEDVRLMTRSEEQTLASSLQGIPLSAWETGKEFLAMSDRTQFIFEPNEDTGSNLDSISGRTLIYAGTESRLKPDLDEECVILFTDGSRTLKFPTGKTTEKALKEIDSSKLPLMSDLDLIHQWKNKIKGATLWTKSNLWYDEKGDRQPGQKFAKVTVTDVIPTTGDFPMKVMIHQSTGQDAFIQMNYTSDTYDSRNFAALFFMTDPKIRYPHISEENWRLIQEGKVGLGMTKEECKLSLGNPDELRSGHSQSQLMDIWQYANGTYLMFTDGLLTRFRQ